MADNTVLNPGALGDIIATEDIGGVKYELIKLMFGGNGVATKVDAANPLPVTDTVSEGALLSIAAEDFATEVTLAALLAKVIAAPSTEAKQDAMIALLTTIAAITQPLTDAQLRASAVPVTISGGGGGAATIADGADVTEGAIADAIVAAGAAGTLSAKLRRISQGLEDLKTLITVLPLPTGAATAANQQTNALTDTQLRASPVPVSGTVTVDTSLLAKETKQDTGNTSLASILAKIIAAPATEAKQDTGNTSLASILAKIIAAPSTEAKQDTGNTSLSNIDGKLSAPTAIFNGQTSVTTAGTRVVLAASQAVKSVTIKAFITNTGFIYVGNSSVTSSNGFRLSGGDTVSMDIANLNTVNIDSSVSGESVSYIGVN